MFRHFFGFEIRFWLTGWMVWIFFLVIGAFIFGATSSDNITVGGSIGNTLRNAPYVIQNFFAVTSVMSAGSNTSTLCVIGVVSTYCARVDFRK